MWGYCGVGEEYLTGGVCGPSQGNQACPSGTCCSKYGFCGSSLEHCDVSQGCQSGYGQCGLSGSSNDALLVEPWPQWTPFNGKYLNGCPLAGRNIALTFDDGPSWLTPKVLDELASRNMKATFFINAENATKDARLGPFIHRAFVEGHLIASHSYSHPDLTTLTREEVREQLLKNGEKIAQLIGVFPRFFRPPFGNINTVVMEEAAALDSEVVLWNWDSNDWKFEGSSPEAAAEALQRYYSQLVSKANGNILVLNHDRVDNTVNAIGSVLDIIKNAGFTTQTVASCYGREGYRPWATPTSWKPPSTKPAELARRFAPIFRFHPKEKYWPISPGDYFSHFQGNLVSVPEQTRCCYQTEDEALRQALLTHCYGPINVMFAGDNECLFEDRVEQKAFIAGERLKYYTDWVHGDPNPANWRVHTLVQEANENVIHIQYWMFYAFNFIPELIDIPFVRSYDHNADLVSVIVTINKHTHEPLLISLNQHGNYITWPFDPAGMIQLRGEHPIVYVSEGNHEHYEKPGKFHSFSDFVVDTIATDHCADGGLEWDSKQTLYTAIYIPLGQDLKDVLRRSSAYWMAIGFKFGGFYRVGKHVQGHGGYEVLAHDQEMGVRPIAYQQDFSTILKKRMPNIESANSSSNSTYVSTSNSTFANLWRCGSYVESNESVCGPDCGKCPQPGGSNVVTECGPLRMDTDFVGHDLTSFKDPDAEACCSLCRSVKGCTAFTWSNYEGGTCWLKSEVTEVSAVAGVKSAVITRQCSTLLFGYDLVGTDIGSARSAKPEDCCSLCNARNGCKSFSWNSYNNGTCWLKSGDGREKIAAASAVSGVL